MNIKYDIRKLKNSQGSGKNREYVHLYEMEPMTPTELEETIEKSCSLTNGDVRSVMTMLCDIVRTQLAQGRRVYLPEIGYLSLQAKLSLPENKTIDKVRGNYIEVRNIKFRPCAELLESVRHKATFEKAETKFETKSVNEADLFAQIRTVIFDRGYINRQLMEKELGLRRTTALQWLRHFTAAGLLQREGTRNAPFYVLAN